MVCGHLAKRFVMCSRVVPLPAAACDELRACLTAQKEYRLARQKIDPHLPFHGHRDSFGIWVYEEYGVKQAQEWLGHSDPATTLRHYVRLTTAARAKAVAGLDELTRAALDRAEEKVLEDARPARDNVVALASRRR